MACTSRGQAAAAASNKAVESAPPLNATPKGNGSESPCSAARAGFARLSARVGFGVGEAAIALQPLIAPLQQLAHLQVAQLAPRVIQCALEKSRHLLVVAVG